MNKWESHKTLTLQEQSSKLAFNFFLSHGNAGRNETVMRKSYTGLQRQLVTWLCSNKECYVRRDQNQSSLLLTVHIPPCMYNYTSSCHMSYPSSITCFRRQFLCKMWPIQIAFLPLIVCRIFLSTWTVCSTSFFTHMFNWSSPAHFRSVPNISDLLSELSRFQQHTKLCSKCSTELVSSLNFSPDCWWKESS